MTLVCSVVLNVMLLSLAVENHDMNYTYVVFSGVFFFVGLLCQRVIYQLIQQYHDEKEEYELHMLDACDDYASREY